MRGENRCPGTHTLIDFLSGVDFSGQSVLEFGAGQSTLWWAERAARVFSVEQDARWFEAVLKAIKSKANVEVPLTQESIEFAATPIGRTFDVIVIDGGDRFLCAQAALKMLQAGGVIVLDNSEGFWGGEGSYPIIDLFEREGFMRGLLRLCSGSAQAPLHVAILPGRCTHIPRPETTDDAGMTGQTRSRQKAGRLIHCRRYARKGHPATCDILRVKHGTPYSKYFYENLTECSLRSAQVMVPMGGLAMARRTSCVYWLGISLCTLIR